MSKTTIRFGPWDQKKKDLEYSRCIGLYYFLNELNAVMIISFGLSGSALNSFRFIVTIIIFLSFLRCIIHFRKNEYLSLLITICSVTVLFIYSWLIGSKADLLMEWGTTTLGICVPLGIFAYNICDKEVLYSVLLKFSLPVLVLLVLNLQGSQITNYDMHFSYMLLYVILFHISYILRKRKYIVIPIVLLEILMLLVYGSRGALICIVAFIVLKVLANVESNTKRVLYIMAALIIAFLIQYSLDNYGTSLLYQARELGFTSRSLRRILDGSVTSYDNARIYIWQNTMDLIKKSPISGYGIRGAVDYLHTSYPHQLFLDLWLSFGVIFGTMISFMILIPSRKVFIGEYSIRKELIQIFFCISFVMLMVSGTVFTTYNFFIYMGLILSKTSKTTEIV